MVKKKSIVRHYLLYELLKRLAENRYVEILLVTSASPFS